MTSSFGSQPGGFETASRSSPHGGRRRPPVQPVDDLSGHNAGQVSALLDFDPVSPAEAQEALARLAELLQRLSREATQLDVVLRYTRALDAVQLLRTVPEQ